jgi:hypothetical protein
MVWAMHDTIGGPQLRDEVTKHAMADQTAHNLRIRHC